MTPQRVAARLRHILGAIAAIENLTEGMTLADYGANPNRAAAVEHYLERLSEASRHLPATL
ncbi:MAG: hypothetical protein QF926_13725 [Alphaproteobacteria bacterium]|jgi:uncharacterized protein with HEPN domain|nr:hypothetical protein [Alphaproteobacteria bacterium]MDP6517659.1 hypothetical protein [Alphaproteobacteria bacterium]|tara:strand:+ start:415 stop:597 length:183 start_codon:yes stop_codon:yes gene_type:complete